MVSAWDSFLVKIITSLAFFDKAYANAVPNDPPPNTQTLAFFGLKSSVIVKYDSSKCCRIEMILLGFFLIPFQHIDKTIGIKRKILIILLTSILY